MYIVDIYWYLKFVLDKVIVDKNEIKEDILITLNQMKRHMIAMDRRLGLLEKRMDVPPNSNLSPRSNKEPIQVEATNLDKSL